jgi:predicted glycogen debranching enzyme
MAVIEIDPNALGLEKAKKLEWILPNKFGGYCASTSIGINTKGYHGLLVSPPDIDFFKRVVVLQEIEECVYCDKEKILNFSKEYKIADKFEFDPHFVRFFMRSDVVDVTKTLNPIPEKNGIELTYEIKNKIMKDITFMMNIILNPRLLKEQEEENVVQEINQRGEDIGELEFELLNDHTIGVKSKRFFLVLCSNKAMCFRNYPTKKRGDLYIPAHFSLQLRPNEETELKIISLLEKTEKRAIEELRDVQSCERRGERMFSSGIGIPIFTLLSTSRSFIVKRDPKLSIIAGYPWYGEKGREAMISLSGLCFINRRFQDAESILERFLNNASRKGIPSRFVDGKPLYEDFDTTLWLIDRLYQYMNIIGEDHFKNFLHTYWWNLKDVMKFYAEKEKDGLLSNEGKDTWMFTLNRKAAIEIQGLWYNALKIMEKFSDLMGDRDDEEINFSAYAQAHAQNFLETFWNGSYLNDSLGDNSLRPNQVIVLSLDFNVIPNNLASKILKAVKEKLLTPYGLHTLSKDDSAYNPKEKFNGAVWPWLLGSFIKARTKILGKRKDGNNYEFIKTLFENHVNREACIGSISEYFEDFEDKDYKSRGCISYSCSVAELLRAYFENILGERRTQTQTDRNSYDFI